MHTRQFLLLVATGIAIPFLASGLLEASGVGNLSTWGREIVSYFLITNTYGGFWLAEKFISPQANGERDPYGEWAPAALYASAMSGIACALAGVVILSTLFEPAWLLRASAAVLVVYHLALRRYWTEPKGTPHLGQRGEAAERYFETLLGLIGDAALVVMLLGMWALTRHPLWLVGCVAFVCCYMLGVTVHHHLDPSQRRKSSYRLVLFANFGMTMIAISITALESISTGVVYAVLAGAAILIIGGRFALQGASIAVGLVTTVFGVALLFGTLSAGNIQTRRGRFLFEAAKGDDLVRFLILVAFLSAGALLLIVARRTNRPESNEPPHLPDDNARDDSRACGSAGSGV